MPSSVSLFGELPSLSAGRIDQHIAEAVTRNDHPDRILRVAETGNGALVG